MSLIKNYSRGHLSFLKRKRRNEEAAANLDLDSYLAVEIETSDSIVNDSPDVNDSTTNTILQPSVLYEEENLHDLSETFLDNQSNIQPLIDNDDMVIFESQIDNQFEIEKNEKLLFAALIATFYSCNLTQTALRIVIEFTQLLTPIKIPKSFDQLMSKIESEQLNYYKTWFCQKCVVQVMLINNKQRNCLKCFNK